MTDLLVLVALAVFVWWIVGRAAREKRVAQPRRHDDLERVIKALGLRTLQLRHLSLSQPGQIERSVADHRRLLRAYAERDKVAAVAMTRALIMGGYRAIERSGLVRDEAPAAG